MKSRITKKIIVEPAERTSVQGRHKQVYTIRQDNGQLIPTTTMGKTKELGTTAEYHFPIDPNKNKLITGLAEMKKNPFKGSTVEEIMSTYALPQSWQSILPKVIEQDRIKKQTIYEIEDGVEPDFYTDEIGHTMFKLPSDINQYGKNRTYLQDLTLILYPRPNPFDDSSPRQRLLMEMIKVLPQIANSKAVVNSAFHDWYISKENEAEEEKARKQEVIEKATFNLYKLKHEHGRYRSYQVAIMLTDEAGRPILKGEATSEKVNNILSDYILDSGRYQMDNIEKFMDIIELFGSVDGMERLEVWYIVQQALNTNIITHRDNEYVWHSKAGTPDVYKLGSSFEKLVNFFFKEYKTYAPDADVTNWYGDLMKEVKARGIWIDV